MFQQTNLVSASFFHQLFLAKLVMKVEMDPIQDSMKSVTLPSEPHFGKIVSEIVQNFFCRVAYAFPGFLIKYSFPFILSAEKFLFLGLLLPCFDPSLFLQFLRESWHNFQIGFQANRIRKNLGLSFRHCALLCHKCVQ